MGSLKALTLAGVVAMTAASTAANAADMLPPPPQLEPPPLRGPVVEESGLYLRGDIGVGMNEISNVRSTFDPTIVVPSPEINQASLGDSTVIGIGVGYQFNSWFRADFTGEYRSSAQFASVASYDSTPFGGTCGNNLAISGRCSDLYTGNIHSAVFLANGYVDLGSWYGLSPYLGAGLGFSNIQVGSFTDHSIGNTGGGYSGTTSTTNFAWALMAGLGYHVSPNLILDMSYRYLNQGTVASGQIVCQPIGANPCPMEIQHFQLVSNDILLGMRWLLIPAAEPVPVLRTRY